MTDLDIHHDATAGRFTAEVAGQRCVADYQLHSGVMHLVHTGVPRALQGRGIAAALVEAALAEARTQRWRVRPVCSYVRAHMRRHPETNDLLETP
jgi:hypothetical protein